MASLIRVRCADDGRELMVEGRSREWRVQAATIKRLVLQQRRQSAGSASEGKEERDEDDEDEGMEESFLLFQGRILADSDTINLFSLSPTDFLVFVQETPPAWASGPVDLTPSKRPRLEKPDAPETESVRRQLLEMGFDSSQVSKALNEGMTELSQIIEWIMSGHREDQRVDGQVDGVPQELEALLAMPEMHQLHEVARADPFQALILLREQFLPEALMCLNGNPSAVVRMLMLPRLPVQSISTPATQPAVPAHSEVVDMDTGELEHGDSQMDSAISRVRCSIWWIVTTALWG